MDLRIKIIERKITDVDQLSPAGRRMVAGNPELLELIEENKALSAIEPTCPAVPQWENLRHEVINRAQLIRQARYEAERIEQLPLLQRLAHTQPFFARAAAAAATLVIVFALVGMLPTNQSDGSIPVQIARNNMSWINYSLFSSSGRNSQGSGQQHINHP